MLASPGSMQIRIHQKVVAAFDPLYVDLVNESHRHSGPATESHFKLTLVSEVFQNQRPLKRHQAVYTLLAEELKGGVHALSLHLFTPAEWDDERQQVPASPDCRGGSRVG